jgi:phosphomevalonate kinase
MIDVSTSAPGKVVIAGEYAVLDGAPAICMAVDRRAHVSITTSDNDYHSVLAPGFSESAGRFTAVGNRIEWLAGADEFSLLEAVWQEAAPTVSDNLTIVLDSNDFIDPASSVKLGIGSSAALTVALIAAFDRITDGDINVLRAATDAHRRFQQGSGSGVDIACSLAGGLIEYRMGGESISSLTWPNGLAYALLWSGVAASTDEKLNQLAKTGAGQARAELVVASARVAASWREGNPIEILQQLRDYTKALRKFDVDHRLGIFDAGHAELADAAASAGLVYKPCGAGGGDIGIVIANDVSDIATFVDAARESEFKQLNMAIDETGIE